MQGSCSVKESFAEFDEIRREGNFSGKDLTVIDNYVDGLCTTLHPTMEKRRIQDLQTQVMGDPKDSLEETYAVAIAKESCK